MRSHAPHWPPQWLCAHAAHFVGTHTSLFTETILEEREQNGRGLRESAADGADGAGADGAGGSSGGEAGGGSEAAAAAAAQAKALVEPLYF